MFFPTLNRRIPNGVHFSLGAAVRQADVPGGMMGFYAVAVAVENRGLEVRAWGRIGCEMLQKKNLFCGGSGGGGIDCHDRKVANALQAQNAEQATQAANAQVYFCTG
jgi:hypothetical protein